MSKPTILRSLLIQLVFLILLVIALFFGLKFFLKAYTHHGSSIEVPNVTKMDFKTAKQELKNHKLNVAIQDSTFTNDLPPGTIIDQNPKPSSIVKKSRTVYLIVNSSTPPPVKMPDLVDTNLKIARIKLNNLGLKVGKTIYKPDIAKDAVLRQLHNGKPIAPGSTILKGEAVDLELGDGFGNTTMKVPDLIGLSYEEAILNLQERGLRIGNISKTDPDLGVRSSMVYEQSPSYGGTLEMGEKIDLYLTEQPSEL